MVIDLHCMCDPQLRLGSLTAFLLGRAETDQIILFSVTSSHKMICMHLKTAAHLHKVLIEKSPTIWCVQFPCRPMCLYGHSLTTLILASIEYVSYKYGTGGRQDQTSQAFPVALLWRHIDLHWRCRPKMVEYFLFNICSFFTLC